jgi:hypothetical protein
MNLYKYIFHKKFLTLLLIPFFLKLLIVIPFLFRERIVVSFNFEKFIIQALLLSIIIYITTFDLTRSGHYFSTLKNISPFCLALFFSFIQIDYKNLFEYKKCIYLIFLIDFFTNITSIILNINVKLTPVNYFDSPYHSLLGIFGHPYLSVTLSAVALLYATLFNDKKMQILSIFALVVGSTLRSLLLLYPIIIIYFLLARRIRVAYILFAIFFGIILIFQYVRNDSNLEESKRCDLNIHSNKYYNCKQLNSSALRYYAWTYFFESQAYNNSKQKFLKDQEHEFSSLTPETIKEKRIFESPYLQTISDYGFPLFFLNITLFLVWFLHSYFKYIKISRNSFSKNLYASKVTIAGLFIFDSFYGVFFSCIISSLTVFYILFFETKDEA